MISDELGQILHDKSTTGVVLSNEEQAQLEEWYDYQDKLEMGTLLSTQKQVESLSLQTQIENALVQLLHLAEQVKQIVIENEKIRNENTMLKTRLAQHLNQQRA